jgi:hypothetical protein
MNLIAIFKIKKVPRSHVPGSFPEPSFMGEHLSQPCNYIRSPINFMEYWVGLIEYKNVVLVKCFAAFFVEELADPA